MHYAMSHTQTRRLVSLVSLLCLGQLWLVACNKPKSSETLTAQVAPSATPNPAKIDPFASNNGQLPPPSVYNGPLFSLSHNYPTATPTPPANPPWQQALKGKPITQANALAYVRALKDYITPDMRRLLLNYQQWNADQAGWYNQPWVMSRQNLTSLREPIHGLFVGSEFSASTFQQSGLKVDMTTYVLDYYDKVTGYTVGQFWGQTAWNPNLTTAAAQFPEGGIIIKPAFTTASGTDWPVMDGALAWPVYAPATDAAPPTLFNVYLMQFDIIVKDTKTAPKTGWVFSTLVYDKRVKGDAWDQMIPMGAMWGNDPDVNSATNPPPKLNETVLNPAAPDYSKATLGWGGRLSGPNDGAVVAPAVINNQTIPQVAASSCMSCHGPAEYTMKSFLLPATTNPPQAQGDALVLDVPGSPAWMQWFQDRPGTQPQDVGQVALDYDMVFSFKSLPAWHLASGQKEPLSKLFERADALRRGLRYNGLDSKAAKPQAGSLSGR